MPTSCSRRTPRRESPHATRQRQRRGVLAAPCLPQRPCEHRACEVATRSARPARSHRSISRRPRRASAAASASSVVPTIWGGTRCNQDSCTNHPASGHVSCRWGKQAASAATKSAVRQSQHARARQRQRLFISFSLVGASRSTKRVALPCAQVFALSRDVPQPVPFSPAAAAAAGAASGAPAGPAAAHSYCCCSSPYSSSSASLPFSSSFCLRLHLVDVIVLLILLLLFLLLLLVFLLRLLLLPAAAAAAACCSTSPSRLSSCSSSSTC